MRGTGEHEESGKKGAFRRTQWVLTSVNRGASANGGGDRDVWGGSAGSGGKVDR